jgi:iron complex transport system substrate-binding protein
MPSIIKAATFVAVALLSSTLFAQTTYPLTVIDGMGNEFTLKKQPSSISSKTLFTDEVLLQILDHTRISSLTNLATDSNFSNISDKIPEGKALLDFNVEAILNNFPDIVFAANWSDAGKVTQLQQAGINVYLVNTPTTVESIQQEIVKIGRILNIESEAQALVETMDQTLADMAKDKKALENKNWVALDYNSWGTSSGVDTTWNTVLSEAGIINGSAAYEQGAYGQVAMSKELIVEVNPDVLFLPGWIYGESDAANNFVNQVMNDPALAGVTAIKMGRVFQIPENLRGTFSQYIVDTIGYVVENVGSANP